MVDGRVSNEENEEKRGGRLPRAVKGESAEDGGSETTCHREAPNSTLYFYPIQPRSGIQDADDDTDYQPRQRRTEAQRNKDAQGKKKARAEQAATKDCQLFQLSPRPAHWSPFSRTSAIAARGGP